MILHEKELLAYLAGQEVEYRNIQRNTGLRGWGDFNSGKDTMDIFNRDVFEVRVKPQTIKVEFEMPRTFIPSIGEIYWCLDDIVSCGYRYARYNLSTELSTLSKGVWNTEEKVKQVVEALNSFRKQGLK